MQIEINSKFCEKKSGFVNSRLGVLSDEQDIYHQYFHFQLNLCHSCILPNILLKCRKAGCQLATTQWNEIKSEGLSFFCNPSLLQYIKCPIYHSNIRQCLLMLLQQYNIFGHSRSFSSNVLTLKKYTVKIKLELFESKLNHIFA